MAGRSKQDITKLRERMTAQGRGVDEIAAEIRHMLGCSLLAAYRHAHGLSQVQVADRFYAQSPEEYLDQPMLSRIELFPGPGSRRPQAKQIITLAVIYQTTPLRLLDQDALDALDEAERQILVRCNTAYTASAPSPPLVEKQAPASRPTFLHRATSDGLRKEIEMAARRALRFATVAEGSNIGPEILEQLRTEVVRLARAYPQQPLPALLADLIELQDVAFQLLEGRQRPAETTEMYLLAGALSGMLAKASHDVGDPRAAMTQARTAFICADNIGHDGLRAWTRGLQSLIAYWAGWAHDAARFAQSGAEFAARTRGTASVWLAAQEARVLAVLGDGERALAALARADAARDQVHPDELDEFGGILTFPRPRQLYYAADARIWMPGSERIAEETAAEAINAYTEADPADRSFSDEAGARADQALARVNLGDLEGAADALAPVLSMPVEERIDGVVRSVRRIYDALRAPRLITAPKARTMRQEIETFTRIPAAAALPRGR